MSTTIFTASPEQSLRARTKAVWEAGDFGIVARYTESAAADFAGRLPHRGGRRLLDVACGTGNLARAAARTGWIATGVDLASNLVAQARLRAANEGLDIGFLEADAECLPFPDASFDCLGSMFGIMFAPRAEEAVRELLRVCRSGGVIALAHWTPGGMVGEYLRTVLRHCPAAPNSRSATDWGEEAFVSRNLGKEVEDLRQDRRTARTHYPFPPNQAVDFFRQFHGPTLRAFASIDPDARALLHTELEALFRRHNRAVDGTTLVEAEYLEVVGIRR